MSDIFSILLLESISKSTASAWLLGGEIALLVSSIAVVAGLWGENKNEKWVPPPSRIKNWHRAYVAMVIIGVAGELVSDGDVFLFSNRLQTIQEREIARLKEPRGLKAGQSRELSERLRSYGAKIFWIVTETSDSDDRSEQMLLSRQLSGAISNAGWIKSPHVMTPGQTEPPAFSPVSDRGISVQFASDPKSRELGNRVSDDLKNAGLDCENNEDPTQLPDTIILEIGLR
jgi:hypothetical protein